MNCKKSAMLAAVLVTGIGFSTHAHAQQFVTIGSSGAGGTYNTIATAMGKVVNDLNPKVRVNVEATPGGGLGNVRLLGQKRLDFGLATTSDAVSAAHGVGAFKNGKLANLRTILFGPQLPLHAVVLDASPIKDIADMKGRKVVTNSSANLVTFVPDTLSIFGLKSGEGYNIASHSTTEAMDAFKDGRVDAFMSYMFMPAAALLDVGTSNKIRFLSMSTDRVKKLAKNEGIYTPATIPAGTYPGQDKDVQTAGIGVALYAHDEVPADVVYALTKAVLESPGQLEKIYKPTVQFSVDRQKRQFAEGDVVPPLHEGARRYLKEAGILK
jgi:TRAP transporter TAXI family solute receptor